MNSVKIKLLQSGNKDLALALIRMWCGAMMCMHGWAKITSGGNDFVAYVVNDLHMHATFGWLAIGAEFMGGILLMLGLMTRPAALFILVTMCTAGFVAHGDDPWSKKEPALGYAVMALAFFVAGGGKAGIDAIIVRILERKVRT